MASLDEVFDLLSKERRRYALYYLYQRDEPVSIEALARTISDWEGGSLENDVHDDEFENVLLTLEHTHLPKIESADSIEYDREDQQVHITDASREARIVLSIAMGLEQPSNDVDVADLVDIDDVIG